MIYRAWEYGDLKEITALEEVCFAGERWTFEMFSSSFEQDGFFGELCEEDGKLIGYGCIQSVLDSADLLNIAVAPTFRGRGVGKLLLQRLIDSAKSRGVEKLFLEVRVLNGAAQKLYQSAGFSPLSVRKKYYPDGEDALVMAKNL